MKKNLLLVAALALGVFTANAQFLDDMESYSPGSQVFENWWTSWSGTSADAGFASSNFAADGAVSYFTGDDPTAIDPVLDLGNKIFGDWYLDFKVYIPSGKEGYFNIQGEVPIGAGQWVVGNIFFNEGTLAPGEGSIDNSALGAVTFTFPHDAWFDVSMSWDINAGISLATWSMDVDGNNVIPAGTAFTDSAGTTANSLGGINFYAITTDCEMYLDSMRYDVTPIVGSTADFAAKGFTAFPNPVNNVLNIQAKEAISNVAIYNVLGQEVYTSNVDALSSTIDMSQMASGAYFVKVNINGTVGTVKVVK